MTRSTVNCNVIVDNKNQSTNKVHIKGVEGLQGLDYKYDTISESTTIEIKYSNKIRGIKKLLNYLIDNLSSGNNRFTIVATKI